MIRSEGLEFLLRWAETGDLSVFGRIWLTSDRPPVQLMHHMSEPPRSHRSLPARVCAIVTSQVEGLPRCHGISVRPSGRLPSCLVNLTGSLVRQRAQMPLQRHRSGPDVWLVDREHLCRWRHTSRRHPLECHNRRRVERMKRWVGHEANRHYVGQQQPEAGLLLPSDKTRFH